MAANVILGERMRPTIAVIGSMSPDRIYDPPGGDSETAEAAAAEIGRELAARGCRILVFSGRAEFIESAVVRGFVAHGLWQSGRLAEGAVQFHALGNYCGADPWNWYGDQAGTFREAQDACYAGSR